MFQVSWIISMKNAKRTFTKVETDMLHFSFTMSFKVKKEDQ